MLKRKLLSFKNLVTLTNEVAFGNLEYEEALEEVTTEVDSMFDGVYWKPEPRLPVYFYWKEERRAANCAELKGE